MAIAVWQQRQASPSGNRESLEGMRFSFICAVYKRCITVKDALLPLENHYHVDDICVWWCIINLYPAIFVGIFLGLVATVRPAGEEVLQEVERCKAGKWWNHWIHDTTNMPFLRCGKCGTVWRIAFCLFTEISLQHCPTDACRGLWHTAIVLALCFFQHQAATTATPPSSTSTKLRWAFSRPCLCTAILCLGSFTPISINSTLFAVLRLEFFHIFCSEHELPG